MLVLDRGSPVGYEIAILLLDPEFDGGILFHEEALHIHR